MEEDNIKPVEQIKVDNSITLVVKKYVSLTDEINELNSKLKELRLQKSENEELIKKFMEETGYTEFKLGKNISFSLTSSKKSTQKVNKDTIKKTLQSNNVGEYTINTVLDNLYNSDDSQVEVVKIKMTKKQ
jgi:seryl-tRNA synthetase